MKANSHDTFFRGYLLLLLLAAALCAGSSADASPDGGSPSLGIAEVRWDTDRSRLTVTGYGAEKKEKVSVWDAMSGTLLGTVGSDDKGNFRFRREISGAPPCTIRVESRVVDVETGYTKTPPDICVNTPPDPPGPPDAPTDPSPAAGAHAGRFTRYEGTQTCLKCHREEAQEVYSSVHYQWKGSAADTVGLTEDPAGKMGGINDFCIYPDINWIGKLTNVDGLPVDGGCAKCHAGLGEKPNLETSQDPLENIDCLVCHADDYKRKVGQLPDGTFRFVPDTEKMAVTVTQAAANVGRPGKDACLNCHANAGGGNNFKRGDIEEAHRNPSRSFDVHMAAAADGGAGLDCLDCHVASGHRIAGRGSDLRPRESDAKVDCIQCHGNTPHEGGDINKHTARVNCTVCHIPLFAKEAPTDMRRDWSKPGDPVASTGLFEPYHVKGRNMVPEYAFFNGQSYFYQFGDAAKPEANGKVLMSGPMGDIRDPAAKIHAFKRHEGYQPIDPTTRQLLPLKIGKFFENGSLENAVPLGVQGVGWTYNGYEFAETERYLGLFHEVAPKEEALSCNSCHNDGSRIDFGKLGYTPNPTRNNRPLCASCHGDKSGKWPESEYFTKVHRKHVTDKRYDCSACHTFTRAN